MKLVDSNIIIYASKPGFDFLHPLLAEPDVAVSVITHVETLGYHQLTADEKRYLGEFFANVECLPVSKAVVEKAIALRQTRKIKLGDSPRCRYRPGARGHAGHAQHGRLQMDRRVGSA